MSSFDHRETDLFFDSKDCLSDGAEEELGSGELEREFWADGCISVRERRESFFSRMGLTELDHKNRGVERITECSGAETSSSSIGLSVNGEEEELGCCRREVNCGANSSFDDTELGQLHKSEKALDGEDTELSLSTQDCEECNVLRVNNKKTKSWWKRLSFKNKGRGHEPLKLDLETSRFRRKEVKHNSKRCKELTALYAGQEIQAHKGIIQTMKFSPDGQYLASGGEDGVVRIWRATSAHISRRDFSQSKLDSSRKNLIPSSVVIPDKVFHFDEAPLQELHGHTSDILDLAWSGSNCLISSSKDQTVRLWQVGCDECVHVFSHNNYVTCIQFHPVDDNFFISGSIDGIVRIWSILEKRVVDWTDTRHIVTAVCYQPDGKGFVVGSIEGKCRFYDASGADIQLDTQVNVVPGRKKTSSRITGIQFSHEDSQRLMITSEDSKIRIFEKTDVVYRFKGCAKSGSQVSATFTPTGNHIVSVGENSRVYIWNYDESSISASKHKKQPVRSCEHFFSEGTSIAIPWPGSGMRNSSNGKTEEASCWVRNSERGSLGGWFSIDGPCRGSATWPEEELPCWDRPGAEEHNQDLLRNAAALPETWGLVIVAAGRDGKIRTFHNYGLPVRLKS